MAAGQAADLPTPWGPTPGWGTVLYFLAGVGAWFARRTKLGGIRTSATARAVAEGLKNLLKNPPPLRKRGNCPAEMRGQRERSGSLFSYVLIKDRIPASHPLRRIRKLADHALDCLNPTFCELYAAEGSLSSR
ncbi:hypothetical protein WH5701_09269 [Synechococcus sp. WH 5701]|nr:hypothetical protein WH5701_09269 [Synechococcus sp. WH 5701]